MAEKEQYFYVLREKEDREAILRWWASLEEVRKDRAQLRRCESPMQVMLYPGFHRLIKSMKSVSSGQIPALAGVAGLLSHVREHIPRLRFGQQLGQPKESGGKAPVSELRFYQLQKSRDLEEFYRRMRRTLWLLDRKTNVLSFTDCALHWDREMRGQVEAQPSRRFQFRMAQDYFSQVSDS